MRLAGKHSACLSGHPNTRLRPCAAIQKLQSPTPAAAPQVDTFTIGMTRKVVDQLTTGRQAALASRAMLLGFDTAGLQSYCLLPDRML